MDDQPRPEDIPPRPDPSVTIGDDPDAYDALDEASMESFPASDAVASVPSHEGKPDRVRREDHVRREDPSRRGDSGPDASEAPEEKGSASR